ELVQQKAEQKNIKVDIKKLLDIDAQRRPLQQKVDELRAERNKHAESLKQGTPSEEQVAKGREIKEMLTRKEDELHRLQKEYDQLAASVPNIFPDDTPLGGEE